MQRQRVGNKWTTEEEQQLIHHLRQQKTMPQIAVEHQRTVKAIQMRLQSIIRQLLSSSKSRQQIASYLNLDVQTVQELEQFECPSISSSASQSSSPAVATNAIHEQLQEMHHRLQRMEHIMEKMYKKVKTINSSSSTT